MVSDAIHIFINLHYYELCLGRRAYPAWPAGESRRRPGSPAGLRDNILSQRENALAYVVLFELRSIVPAVAARKSTRAGRPALPPVASHATHAPPAPGSHRRRRASAALALARGR